MAEVHVGTSGWVYQHWRERFYPTDLPASDLLTYYAHEFSTVEINYSFYRLPTLENFVTWKEQTPDDFVFAVKASRYITHLKRLKEPAPALERLFSRVSGLGGKLGPVLFQLPSRWSIHLDRLVPLLELLPVGQRCVFEFRDPSWFVPEVFRALETRGAAVCFADRGGPVTPFPITTDFVYIRLHGGGATGGYPDGDMRDWAGRIASWSRQGLDVYAYFNNDWDGWAVANARQLIEMLGPKS
ncbi:MAG: DUF72 domain-containing protein [Chloroflexota bacterium]|nr:MAG: DUF72 domain-containing protein [Chloroflexota bacterium]